MRRKHCATDSSDKNPSKKLKLDFEVAYKDQPFEDLSPENYLIDDLWIKYVMEERSNVGAEVELLSKNQKKLLTVLSRTNGTYFPLGSDFIQFAKMSKATVDQSLTFLERHDYISKAQDGFVSVLDPLIKAALSGVY